MFLDLYVGVLFIVGWYLYLGFGRRLGLDEVVRAGFFVGIYGFLRRGGEIRVRFLLREVRVRRRSFVRREAGFRGEGVR